MLPISQALVRDLEKLATRAYHAVEWSEDILSRYHALAPTLKGEQAPMMRRLYEWFFVPSTLWPFNLTDLFGECLTHLEKGCVLPDWHCLIIDLLPDTPSDAVCDAVAEHERHVQSGSYEDVVKTQAKFSQTELALRSDPDFLAQWDRIKTAFDISGYQDHKGVLRRTMGAERNMRPIFGVNMRLKEDVFRAAFDAFCLRWNLYGMQHDDPLLLKLAVNVTPHGTMILIPSYWSFDPKRDIRWDAITKLHRTRVPGRQGTALAEGLADRKQRAAKLHQLDAEALRLKLRGEKKHEFLCQGLALATGTSPRRLSRLRKEFPAA